MSDKAVERFDLPAQARVCALCPNMCRFLCPVASVEKVETVTPRGKAMLAVQVERGETPLTAETAAVFYRCATCKVCREWCPSNVDLPDVTGELRGRAARRGLAPEAARNLAARLVRDRSPYGPAAELGRGFARYRRLLTPGAKVLYFAGCSTAALHPEVVEATLRLFEAAGARVAMLEAEECCGLPLDVLGYRDEAAQFAHGLARAVAAGGFARVVSGCPMCTYILRERYPALDAPLGVRIEHVTEFLFGLHEEGALLRDGPPAKEGPPARDGLPANEGAPARDGPPANEGAPARDGAVTYHDPCYLGRYQGVYDAPRRLLTDVAGLKLIEMESSRELAACCGGAPATDTVVPGTATAIGTRRLEEARRTGTGTLVAACPHCLDMLAPAAEGSGAGARAAIAGAASAPRRAANGLAVRDITVVLAERFGLLPGRWGDND